MNASWSIPITLHVVRGSSAAIRELSRIDPHLPHRAQQISQMSRCSALASSQSLHIREASIGNTGSAISRNPTGPSFGMRARRKAYKDDQNES